MKRLLTITILIMFCLSLTSCELVEAFKALKGTITGEIVDSADGFERGEDYSTLIYKNNKYILVEEINGETNAYIQGEDVYLGYSSNFPFFPGFMYYTSTDENPKFICSDHFVYLREDIYNNGIIYVLEDSSYEFEFSSAFIKTDAVNYSDHVADKNYTEYKKVNFYMKDIPEIAAEKEIYLIGNTWYNIEKDEAYQLSDEFSQELGKAKYKVSVTGDKSDLIEPINSSYAAGSTVVIKAYPVCDAELYVFVNGKKIRCTHSDSDYRSFEFVMPEEDISIHLTYDQFYGKDEYEFNEVNWSYEIYSEYEITKVAITTTNRTDENSFITTHYSTSQEDIDNFRNIFSQKLIKIDNSVASSPASEHKISLYFKTSDYRDTVLTFDFNDDYFTYTDFSSWQAFKFYDPDFHLPTIKNPDLITYSFEYKYSANKIKQHNNGAISIPYYNINSIEFIPYNNPEMTFEPKFYVESHYGKINMITETIFELNGEFYEIVYGADYWAYSYIKKYL